MKITNYEDVQAQPVTEQGASGVTVRWVISEEDQAPNFFMRVFHIEPGGYTPSHKHPWEHEVFVLEGNGSLQEADEQIPLARGDVVFVAPAERHQFKNVGDEKLTFICLIPRPD